MSPLADDERKEGVVFIHEDDGRITARDIETGVASFGETKAEALTMLAEALELHEEGGEPVTDEDLVEWVSTPTRTVMRNYRTSSAECAEWVALRFPAVR